MKHKLIVKQVDESDCGVCCLLSIIRYYKGNVPLEILKIDTNTNKFGTNAFELIEAASKYGFEGKGLKIEKISSLNLPLIAHLKISEDFYHFVVIYKIYNNNITLMDPAQGKIKMSLDNFYNKFTGYVIEITPITEITYLKQNIILNKIIKLFFKQNKKDIIKLYFIEFILIIVVLINSFSLKLLSDKINIFAICFLGCIILKLVLNIYKNKKLTSIKHFLQLNLTKNLFSHILHLPLKYIQLKTSGEILTRFKELNLISDFIINVLFKNIIEIIIFLFGLFLILIFNFQIGLMILLFSFVYIIFSYYFIKIINPRINKEINNESSYNSKLTEYINSLETIKNLNNIKFFSTHFNLNLKERVLHSIELEKIINYSNIFKELFSNLTYLILIFYSFYLKIPLINIITLLNLEMVLFDTLTSLLNDFPLISFIKSIFIKINEFFCIDEETIKLPFNIKENSITFDKVKFMYNKNQVLNYNFYIKANSFVMIKGKNGSGKSTICKLLTKIITEYTGNILIGEKNIKDYNDYEIKEIISYSNQSSKIFKDTIKNNIILDLKINEDMFSVVSKICDLESVVSKKKNRFETIVYENSPNFSGGEIQKIILARTLIKNSKIIILDETLSAVNLEDEIKIIKELKEYFKDRTIIYITHKDLDKYFDTVINLN